MAELNLGQMLDGLHVALCVLDDIRNEDGLTEAQERAYEAVAAAAGISPAEPGVALDRLIEKAVQAVVVRRGTDS